MLAVEEMPEEHLVLSQGLVVQHQRDRPLHLQQHERFLLTTQLKFSCMLHLVSKGKGIHAGEQGGVTGLILGLLHRVQGLDLPHLEAEVIRQECHPQVVLVLVAVRC